MKRFWKWSLAALPFILAGALTAYAAWPAAPPPQDFRAQKLILRKADRCLELIGTKGRTISFTVALGSNPKGPKHCQGDGRTPEGHYVIDQWLDKGVSSFYRAVHLSYPSAKDRQRAGRLCPSGNPGGRIMIHGLPVKLAWLGRLHRLYDWTQGCIALTNREMDILWRAVPPGRQTPIEILP